MHPYYREPGSTEYGTSGYPARTRNHLCYGHICPRVPTREKRRTLHRRRIGLDARLFGGHSFVTKDFFKGPVSRERNGATLPRANL
jgi:hypothetical protein